MTYSARQYGDISSRGALAATTYKNFRPFAHPAAGSSCKFVLARLSHNLCTDYTKKVFTFYCHALRLKPVHDNKKVNAELVQLGTALGNQLPHQVVTSVPSALVVSEHTKFPGLRWGRHQQTIRDRRRG